MSAILFKHPCMNVVMSFMWSQHYVYYLSVYFIRSCMTFDEVVQLPLDGVQHVLQLSGALIAIPGFQQTPCQHRGCICPGEVEFHKIASCKGMRWRRKNMETFIRLYVHCNVMAAEGVATQGARTPAIRVLALFTEYLVHSLQCIDCKT